MQRPVAARRSPSRRLPLAFAAVLVALVAVGGSPAPASATSSGDMARMVLQWMNRDREARGLKPYRSWGALQDLAGDRARRMASYNTLSHTAAGGSVGSSLTARGIQWYGFGEIIGMSSYPWGTQSANNIYSMWKNSSPHAALMFNSSYNYVGVGVAYRSSNHTTWMSVVFTESKDHSAPYVAMVSIDESHQDVTVRWKGWDTQLQTHTAGFASFDVEYRVDWGSWHYARDNTTATSLVAADRPHGHWYGFRARGTDLRGNLSRWTSELRVWVP
jgi:uncharacterized protein YkwD